MKKLLTVLTCLMLAVTAFGQWEMVKGPEEYNYLPDDALALDTATIVAIESNTISKSIDFGETWTEILVSTKTLREVENHENVLYVCADDGLIYKSSDMGDTWAEISDTNFVWDLDKLDVLDSNNVFMGAEDGYVVKTADGGATWDTLKVDTPDDINGGVAFADASNGIAFSNGTGDAIYTTHDGGASWTATGGAWPPGLSTRQYDAVYLGSNTYMVAGYNNVIWKSTDLGDTWTLCSEYTYATKRITKLEVLDATSVIAMSTGGVLFTTDDTGASWDTLSTLNVQGGEAFAFTSLTDGRFWQKYNNEFIFTDGAYEAVNDWPATPFYAVDFADEGEIFVTANYGGEITQSMDNGVTWDYPTNVATGATSSIYEIKFIDTEIALAGGSNGLIIKTVDGGATWTKIENPMSALSYKTIYFIYIAPGGNVYAGGSSGMLMVSDDNGDTWTEIESGTAGTLYGMSVFSNGLGFLGASSGRWCMSTSTVLDTFEQVTDMGTMNIRQAHERNGVILVAANDDVYKMDEDYDSLYSVFDIPSGGDAYALQWVSDTVAFFAGSSGNIYRTEDAGDTWIQEMSGADDYIYDLKYDGEKLWAVGKYGLIMSRKYETPKADYSEEFTDGTADITWVENVAGANAGGLNLTVVADSAGLTNVGIYTDDDATGLLLPSGSIDRKLYNYEVSADVYIVKEQDAEEALYKGITVKCDPDNYEFYRFVYRNSSSSNGQLRLQGFDGANWYISQYFNPGVDFDTLETGFHNFKAQVVDNKFWLYIDGELLPGCPYSHSDPQVVTAGYPGIYKYNGGSATVAFDNFKVKVFDYPKYDVTANVDMGIMVRREEFNPAASALDIIGTFDGWTGTPMTDADADTIYTASLGDHEAGTTIEFKCRRNGAWDNTEEFPSGGANRSYTVTDDGDQVIPTFLYSDITEVAIDGVPGTFALEQNYPNPFNPATTVKFQIPNTEMVNISLYNVAGRKVAEVMNDHLEAGYYSVNFNAASLPSGVYLYRITAGEFSDVKKMTLLK